jgi:hypothetical protein
MLMAKSGDLRWEAKDPDETLDFDLDLSKAELLVGSEVMVSAPAVHSPTTVPDLSVDSVVIDNSNVRVRYFISGGLAGTDYELVCTITTDSTPARIFERTVVLPVRDL